MSAAEKTDDMPTLKFEELEAAKRYDAYAPNGEPILGTLEAVTARSEIAHFQKPGDVGCEYEYAGGSEIFWDGMETQMRDGKTLFLCAAGEEWTVDQLVFEEQGSA